MAYSKKVWKDRVSEQPQRRLITPVGGGSATTVDVVRQEGIVIQEGDAFSAANMNDLENRIKNCFDSNESTINVINTKANTNADNITSLQNNLNSVSGRVTANTNSIAANQNTEASHYNALSTRASNLESRAATIEGELTANNQRIYMDYKYGKYGINTSANRGADTFIPFKNMTEIFTHLPTSVEGNVYREGIVDPGNASWGYSYITLAMPGNCTITITAIDGTDCKIKNNTKGTQISTVNATINCSENDSITFQAGRGLEQTIGARGYSMTWSYSNIS